MKVRLGGDKARYSGTHEAPGDKFPQSHIKAPANGEGAELSTPFSSQGVATGGTLLQGLEFGYG